MLKDDGTFWLAIGDEYAAELKIIATRELGLTCRSWVVWYYTFGVHCKSKFTRSHAHLFYFVKDPKRFTFNDMAVRVPSARQLVYGDKRANSAGRVPDDTWMMTPRRGGLVPVAGAHIIFKSDDGHTVKALHGDVDGKYTIDLPKGWYTITATAPSCRDYTAPAPAAVTGGGTFDHLDIHMEKR